MEPIPAALSNQLKVCAFPLKISFAKTGIKVLNEITNKLLQANIKSILPISFSFLI